MWWRGPQGPIIFEELGADDPGNRGLGIVRLRERHPEDWQAVIFVLWLLADDTECVNRSDVGDR